MCLHDGLADRQSQANPRDTRFVTATHKLLEHPLAQVGRHTRPMVTHANFHGGRQRHGRDFHRAAVRRVLDNVFQQVMQHQLDQHPVELQQRQGVRQVEVHRTVRQTRLQAAQGTAHQLLEHLPIPGDLHLPPLQARHVQQLVNQGIDAEGLVTQVLRHGSMLGQQGRHRATQRVGQAGHRRQRRAQVVRHRRQQRIAQALGAHLLVGLGCYFNKMHPFQADRGQSGPGLQQAPLFRRHQPPRPQRLQRQHAAHAHRRAQGHIEHRSARQGIGALPGWLTMIQHPARHAAVDGIGRQGTARRRRAKLTVHLQRQQRCLHVQAGMRKFRAQHGNLVDLQGAGKPLCQLIEGTHAAFAQTRHSQLKAQAGHQLTQHQGHRQHHGKGQQVLGVADGKGKPRRHEEEIKGGHRQEGRQHCRSLS